MPEAGWYKLSAEVAEALAGGGPVVALESTVFAHGLPRPRNVEVARELESLVREDGATPATIAVLDGVACVGLAPAEIERVGTSEGVEKLSTRDLGVAIARGVTGATTVAATAHIARAAGISVFATGGIGGVHRGPGVDISADLFQLGQTSIIVACSGAKSILDLPATREILETLGVLVLGWGTSDFPSFYSRESGLAVDARIESAAEVADIWLAHRTSGVGAAIVLAVPVPESAAMAANELEELIGKALERSSVSGIRGKEVTPYLLAEIRNATGGKSVDTNVALLKSNAAVAAQVAREIVKR